MLVPGKFQKNVGIFNCSTAFFPAFNGILQLTDGQLSFAGLIGIVPEVGIKGKMFQFLQFFFFGT
jgi:hypothetical protein